MIKRKEYQQYWDKNGYSNLKTYEKYPLRCWHCRQTIQEGSKVYEIGSYINTINDTFQSNNMRLKFHEDCFQYIAGQEYIMEDPK